MAGDVEMAVKPMNCPCHIQIFNTGLRSWRDLPMRLAEFGKCHRYEPAGTMHGLMRVRGFVQDDAHIFCTEDQIASEVADFCALVKESEQAECRDKMLAFWHDRGAAADAKGVKSTTTSVSIPSW